MKSNTKGITLVALVITIVILIILATVTVNNVFGDNGLIKQAERSRIYQENAILADSELIEEASDYIDNILDKKDDDNQEYKQNETINSIKLLDETHKFYYMEYTADYKYDEFLFAGGARTQEEVNEFVSNNLLNGQKINFTTDDNVFCTTFSGRNAEGQTIFGRNLDIINDTPVLIVKTIPTNADYKSISTVHLGMFLDFQNGIQDNTTEEMKKQLLMAPYVPMDGMNEKGVTIAILALNYKFEELDTEKNDLTIFSAMRLILDKAANVDEAINLLKQYDMSFEDVSINAHYQIADAEGNSAVIEWIDGELNIIKAENNFQVCTNFYLSPLMSDDDKTSGTAKQRYNTAYTAIESVNGVFEESQAMELLQAVSQGNATKWSVVYNSGNLTADIAPYTQYDEKDRIKVSI